MTAARIPEPLVDGGLVGLVGAGGFAREVMAYLLPHHPMTVFVQTTVERDIVNGVRCVSMADFVDGPAPKRFNIAIADSASRESIADDLERAGAEPLTIVAPSATWMATSTCGVGAILCDYSMITANSTIGRYFHANYYSYVAHDCVLGDFVTLAPRASVNGNVHIGDHAYIGAGAVIKQGTPDRPLMIGAHAVVGMGAVVTRDVEPHTTVVGNPARPLERRT